MHGFFYISFVFGGLQKQGYPKHSWIMLGKIDKLVKTTEGSRMSYTAIEQTPT